MSNGVENPSAQFTGVPESADLKIPTIPLYTKRDTANRVIYLVTTGQDPDHPVFGLGDNLVILDQIRRKRRDGAHYFTRFVFPQKPGRPEPGGLELSYSVHEYPNGHAEIYGGWFPRSKESW